MALNYNQLSKRDIEIIVSNRNYKQGDRSSPMTLPALCHFCRCKEITYVQILFKWSHTH